MQVKVNKIILLEYLNMAKIFLSKTRILLTESFLLQAKENILTVSATDFDCEFNIEFECEVIQEGKIAVNGNKLLQIIKNLENKEVILKANEKSLIVEDDNSKYELFLLDTEDWSKFENFDPKTIIEFEKKEFEKVKLPFVCSNDNNHKIYCQGVTFDIVDKNKLNFIGTDNIGLVIFPANANILKENADIKKINIPKKALKKILVLIFKLDEDNKIVFNISPYLTKVAIENFYFKINIVTKNLEENIPDISGLMERFNEECNIIKINKANFFKGLKKISILTNDENTVIIKADKEQIILTGNNNAVGKGQVIVKNCEIRENVKFAVNYNYLYILENYLPDEFTIQINNPDEPMLINTKDLVYLFAPVLIEENIEEKEVA